MGWGVPAQRPQGNCSPHQPAADPEWGRGWEHGDSHKGFWGIESGGHGDPKSHLPLICSDLVTLEKEEESISSSEEEEEEDDGVPVDLELEQVSGRNQPPVGLKPT